MKNVWRLNRRFQRHVWVSISKLWTFRSRSSFRNRIVSQHEISTHKQLLCLLHSEHVFCCERIVFSSGHNTIKSNLHNFVTASRTKISFDYIFPFCRASVKREIVVYLWESCQSAFRKTSAIERKAIKTLHEVATVRASEILTESRVWATASRGCRTLIGSHQNDLSRDWFAIRNSQTATTASAHSRGRAGSSVWGASWGLRKDTT